MTQSGRHDAISISCVNPKIKRWPVKRRHIVLIYSSLLSVGNCDTSQFGDIVVPPGTVHLKIGWLSATIPPCLRRAAG
jgi:hypothetical protein